MTKRTKIVIALMASLATAGGLATTASAQSLVRQAISDGIVGETASGYYGFAQTPSAALRAQVDAINLGRRSAYADLAQQRGTTRQQVAAETACSRLQSLDPGEAYQLRDGIWRIHQAGSTVPTPDYC
jgi:uncharacterized protein YdbL (DUF1318 family)